MTRQLLPRQGTQLPAPGRARAPGGTAAPPPAPPATSRRLRRPAVLALVAAATVVLAGLGWALVKTPQEVPADNASVLLRPRASTSPSPTVLPSVTPTGAPRSGAGQAGAPGSRDPFGGSPAATVGVTSPGSVSGTTPAGAAPAVTTTVTTAPSEPAVTTTATVTSTVTSTVTRTSAPTVTPTVTMTAPGTAVYVGFYAWNGNKASFRVNARTQSKVVGSTFGPQLTFTAIVPGTPRCARLTYRGGTPFVLCPGQVVKLP